MISTSHPARRALIGDQLRRNARRIPDAEAIVAWRPDGRSVLTFAQLDDAANRFANVLLAAGIGRGDVIAVMGRNCPELQIGFWGAVKAGAAVTGVNFTFLPGELHYQLSHSRAKAILVADEVAGKLDDLEPLPALQRVIRVSELEALLAAASPDEPVVELDENDPVMMAYTSGTTALPKAVMLPHRSYLVSTIPAYAAALGFREGDRFYFVMPFHTVSGLGTQMCLLSVGATVVLPSEMTPDAALRTLVEERITMIGQTPTFYLQVLRAHGFADADLSALERCVTYGGTMPQAMFDGWAAAAPDLYWITLWSQSEIAQTPTVGRFRSLADIPGQDAAWIGRPVAQLEIRVVDDDGVDADEGELLCRTPACMLGYLDDEERTAQTIRDGWLHTGDLVRRDGQDLFFVDRRHDVIKSGGMNVSSVEVERVLYAHTAVEECAVVGMDDDYWGQAVTAFVVARADVAAEELIAHTKSALASFKVPKRVEFVDALPKDTQGKILKREIRRAGR